MGVHTSWRRVFSSALVAAVLGSGLALAAPAFAAVGAPEDLAPYGEVSTTTPTFSWSRVDGAVKYEIQTDDAADYSSPAFATTTTNFRYVPVVQLATGVQHWRVRALDAANVPSAWASSDLTIDAVAPPTPQSPADGTALTQPGSPPLLSWSVTSGAVDYTVQVDKETDFVGALSYTTKVTSLVIPAPLEATTYHWRVKAKKATGIESAFSEPVSFTVGALKPVDIVSPDDDPNNEVEDVQLAWKPVEGAQYYQLRVATDTDFNTIVDNQIKVLGTHYSPPVTYDNNQYYWQVRAVDLSGNPAAWSTIQANFNRVWPDRPQPVHPVGADTPVVTGAPYFQWTPVQHATHYQLDVGTDPNFSPGYYDSCRVAGTTYTSGNGTGLLGVQPQRPDEVCVMRPGVVQYWRVRGIDLPRGVQGIFSPTQSFRYSDTYFSDVVPANAAVVDVPRLSWSPVKGAEKYQIEIIANNGAPAVTATTYSTSYTPVGVDRLTAAKSPYTWKLTAVEANGTKSVTVNRTFSVSGVIPAAGGTPLTPLSGRVSDPLTTRAPALSWEPYPGADHYRVSLGNAGTDVFWTSASGDVIGKDLPYPGVTDTSTRTFTPGSYDWFVTAYGADDVALGRGPVSMFRISGFPDVTGQELALDGASLDAGTTCTARLSTDGVTGPKCDAVPATPVFSWDAQPDMSYYMLYISEDASFTNLVDKKRLPATTNSRFALTFIDDHPALAESKAGQAYYWYVRPCKASGVCGPDPVSSTGMATNAFRKESPAVVTHDVTTEDVGGAQRLTSTDVTFDWDDYLDTNQAHVWSTTGERSPQAAKHYRLQLSTSSTFSSVIDEVVVDQSIYTASTKLYPEGTLHWRVQAIDADDNGLTWSTPRSFVKQSPKVTVSGPAHLAEGSGTQQFTWAAQAFAGSYELQVNKDGDQNFSDVTKLFPNKVVKQVGYVWDAPIPASDLAYWWRVRRKDASGNDGPWSTPRAFYSRGLVPSLVEPAAESVQPNNGPLFTWDPVDGAASYVLEVRPTGTGSALSPVTTPATAWAAVKALAPGTWEWRVTARDNASSPKPLGVSTWRSFTVATQPRATAAPVVSGSAKVGTPLNASSPTWDIPGVSEAWQWKRDGVAIPGATSPTHEVTAVDAGRALTVTVTGTVNGFDPGTTTSAPVSGIPADAPTATTPTKIAGGGKVGTTLTSTMPTWNPSAGVVSSRQWLRNGTPVFEATDPTFTVRPGDLGSHHHPAGDRRAHRSCRRLVDEQRHRRGHRRRPGRHHRSRCCRQRQGRQLARGDATGLERLRCHQRGPVAARRATHRRRHRHRVRRRRSGRQPVPCRPLHRHLHRARHGRRGEQPGNRQPGRRTHRRVRSAALGLREGRDHAERAHRLVEPERCDRDPSVVPWQHAHRRRDLPEPRGECCGPRQRPQRPGHRSRRGPPQRGGDQLVRRRLDWRRPDRDTCPGHRRQPFGRPHPDRG